MPADHFIATPNASNAPVKVALVAATAKSVIQVVTPATTDLDIRAWGVSFDSAAAGGEALCELLDTGAIAGTVTSLTPTAWGDPNAPASLCVGGTAATGYNASAEGTITASRLLDVQMVNIQTGYSIWYPDTGFPRLGVSRVLRVRVTSPATVNVVPFILWRE